MTLSCMSTQHILMGTHLLYTCNMVVYVSSFKTPFYVYKMVLYAYNIWYTYKIFCTRIISYTTTRDIR